MKHYTKQKKMAETESKLVRIAYSIKLFGYN